MAYKRSAPPRILIFPLLNIDMDVFTFVPVKFCILNGPVSLFRIDFVLPFSIDNSLALHFDLQFFTGNRNVGQFFIYALINENEHL
jgi:hypothetical protein